MRRRLRLLLPLAAAAILAGCGGSNEPEAPTTIPTSTTSVAANTAYERSYSECASNNRVDLAGKYHVKNNENAVSTAVGSYWARRAGGGQAAVDAGKEGCLEGFSLAGG